MRLSTLILAVAATSVGAFAPVKSSRSATHLFGQTKSPPEIPAPESISYGEESRKYRRTVYSHDDWVKFRSPDRFIRNINSIFSSGVYKNVGREVAATTAVATFVVFWNTLTGGYTDFAGVTHDAILKAPFVVPITLPLTPFTLSSSSLGLLLGKSLFRVHSVVPLDHLLTLF